MTDANMGSARAAWALAIWLGAGLAMVGGIDLALLWYPARWSAVDWEFGTISGFFDGLPLMTIGLGVLTLGLVAGVKRGALLAVGIIELLLTLLLVLLLVVYVLDVPVALRAVDAQLRSTLAKAIVKTGLMAGVYVVLYLGLGISAVRRYRTLRKGV